MSAAERSQETALCFERTALRSRIIQPALTRHDPVSYAENSQRLL
jgi:hypothetical protein